MFKSIFLLIILLISPIHRSVKVVLGWCQNPKSVPCARYLKFIVSLTKSMDMRSYMLALRIGDNIKKTLPTNEKKVVFISKHN